MAPDPDLTASVAAVRALFGAAACSCALVDAQGSSLTYVAADGEGAAEIVGVVLPVGRGIAGWAVMSGQPIAVRDVRADPRFARDVAEATHYVPTSLLAAPLFDDEGEALGVLSVLDPGVEESSEWTLAVLGTLASQVAALVCAVRRAPAAAQTSRLEALARRVLEATQDYHR
ncbi:MAG: GAF domain-containing protein [Nocardioides sp.]